MKVYISGKITGTNMPETLIRFEKAEQGFLELGYKAVNPMKLPHYQHDGKWENCMRLDIKHLMDCNAIYMLQGWHESKGATLEYSLALQLGMLILFEL